MFIEMLIADQQQYSEQEMPVDPKYAGLPGIAWDQPDMFETVPGMELRREIFGTKSVLIVFSC